ncbi:Coiled-coil domain-containing protein 63 [Pseudolycoriella hygida]|uniref:Coiled-coil domain-containing protein 63 n=1 Tax=Pseudolycoriella hygida TaxID=35572 RepID=A0A9Q0MPE3_9DIPT|nr:Coiled-coil domain-containing protein 63 [Pseudolycoriella hygida]
MAKAASKSAIDPNVLEMDQIAETELQRLQKQLRKMEKERIAYIEDKKCRHLKRSKIIELLKMERNNLKELLNSYEQGPFAKRTAENEQKLKVLLEKKENVQKKLDEQRVNLWELEGHIKKLEKELRKVQENQMTEKKYKEEIYKAQAGILKLENQLDVVNKKCGDVMAKNAGLREAIDHILLERANFNEMWQKIVLKLEQGKKYITELIDQSTAAYDQREEICNKIQNSKDKGQTEGTVHMQEMRELQRKLDHDAKLQQFFGIKGQRRTNVDLEIREANKKVQVQEQLEQQINNYQNILDNIKTLSGETQIANLTTYFTKQEEENFALFNYVNELSYEVETLNESVQLVQEDIDKQKGENESKEKAQIDTIEILEQESLLSKEKADEAKQMQIKIEKELDELLQGVEQIFKLIRCGDAPILELLKTQKVITPYNVKLFLGIIKQQTNQIINSVHVTEPQIKVLAKKDRIPKFNIKDK